MGHTARRAALPPHRREVATPLAGGALRADRQRVDVRIVLAGVLLLVCDFACLAAAAWVSTTLHPPLGTAGPTAIGPGRAVWMAAVLGPFVLHDRRFALFPVQLGSHALRFGLFAALALLFGAIVQVLQSAPPAWFVAFFVLGLLSTTLTRIVLARTLVRLQRHGPLTEIVAIVGAGPLAERLVQQLRRLRPDTVDVLGIFDDDPGAACDGSIRELLELGTRRRIDWIVLALPPGAAVDRLVQRLMALAVPITSCPQHLGLAPDRPVGYLAGSIPVTLLADRPAVEREDFLHAMEEFVPRWVTTWIRLSLVAGRALAKRCTVNTTQPDVPLALLDHDVTALFCLCGHAQCRRCTPPAQTQEAVAVPRARRARTVRQRLARPPIAGDARGAPATLQPPR